MSEIATQPQGKNLLVRRKARGWGRQRLAIEFERIGRGWGEPTPSREAMAKAIYRHETGQSQVTDEFYRRLYCEALSASPQDLFGDLETPSGAASTRFKLTSHKFSPVYVGPEAIARMTASSTAETCDWTGFWTREISHPFGECTVYGFPWGTLVFHLVEELTPASLAEVAMWRVETYRRELAWTSATVESLLGSAIETAYVLSVFCVDEPMWRDEQLHSAMRLLCTPSAMVSDTEDIERAQLVEAAFLREGYDVDHIAAFGVRGTSIGYASWAGVSYLPIAPDRALPERSLITFEAVVQALWCYCDHVRQLVADGQDPIVEPDYGWRWLSGVRARLVGAWARESTQEAMMRSAILKTSELTDHLDQTLQLLRDDEGDASSGL
ncbi:MAG: hypothetical protein ACRCYU_10165 [Nocardioides sp.]